MNLMEKIKETSSFIKEKIDLNPKIAIILGTGLGNLIDDIDVKHTFNYEDLPNFPVSTVESHKGKLVFGLLEGQEVMVMQGRFHYYEGYNMKEVTFPVRVMKMLGIETVLISNVSGSTNADINKGDLVVIKDHIYLHTENPLTGPNLDEMGPRFPDVIEAYSKRLQDKAMEIAKENNYTAHRGVYASVPGPNLETRAEYVYLNRIGADLVGMSTAPEVIVAVHSGLEVFGLSLITDKGYPPEELEPVTLEMVLAVAHAGEPKLTKIMKGMVAFLGEAS